MKESAPDNTTLCKFRYLPEEEGLNKLFFDAITRVIVQIGHIMKGGMIEDATIIDAPNSTKSADKAHYPVDISTLALLQIPCKRLIGAE